MITRTELKSQAKTQLKGNIGILFLCSIIIFGISFVACLIPVIGSIAGIIITPALSLGFILVHLNVANGKKAEVETLFQRFSCMGKGLWLTVLITFFTYLWSLLLIIPGIVKGLSYSMAFYVLAENPELTAREALNESKRLMNDHKMELFVLYLSFILWDLLVVFTFGIAAIYVVPYQNLTIVNFYQSIKEPGVPVTEYISSVE